MSTNLNRLKMNNPFPTLHQISPTQWEGDSRIIRLKYERERYHLSVGSKDFPPMLRAADVQKIIDKEPRVVGTYRPVASYNLGRLHNNSYTILERSLPRSKGAGHVHFN